MCQALTCGWVQARAWLQVLQKSGGHCRESSKIKASVSVHWLAHKTAKPEWLHRVSVSAGNWTHLTWLPFTGQDTCCDMQEDWCSFNTQYSCWFHFCLSFPATKVFPVDFTKWSLGIQQWRALQRKLAWQCCHVPKWMHQIPLHWHSSDLICQTPPMVNVQEVIFFESSVLLTSDLASAGLACFYAICIILNRNHAGLACLQPFQVPSCPWFAFSHWKEVAFYSIVQMWFCQTHLHLDTILGC